MRVLLAVCVTAWLLILWVHVVVLAFLFFAPDRVDAARLRWPRVARAVDQGQKFVAAGMLLAITIGLTVLVPWLLLRLPSP